MIEFRRTMEMSITITDPRYTEQEIADGLSTGKFAIAESDTANDDQGKVFNEHWEVIATVDDVHISDVNTPDVQFCVI